MDNAADREQDNALDLGLGLNHVLTGGRQNDRYLLYTLRVSISYAKSIDIIVSFLMESGVKMLINDLIVSAAQCLRGPD